MCFGDPPKHHELNYLEKYNEKKNNSKIQNFQAFWEGMKSSGFPIVLENNQEFENMDADKV